MTGGGGGMVMDKAEEEDEGAGGGESNKGNDECIRCGLCPLCGSYPIRREELNSLFLIFSQKLQIYGWIVIVFSVCQNESTSLVAQLSDASTSCHTRYHITFYGLMDGLMDGWTDQTDPLIEMLGRI